jgi:indole-3-acetate monooxygenase
MCIVFDGDIQRMGPNGGPVMIVPVWPASECVIIDTWDTTGLRGTGSDDIAVADLFVPKHLALEMGRPPRLGLRSDPLRPP